MLAFPPQALRVLVLDGQHPQALAVVRSLGRRKAHVTVATPGQHAIAAASRYCRDHLIAPSPHAHSDYDRWLHDALHRERYDVLVYFDPCTAEILAAHPAQVHAASCPLPGREVLREFARRDNLPALADTIGLRAAASHPQGSDASSLAREYAILALCRRGDPVATFVHRLRGSAAESALPWFERTAAESAHQPEIRRLGLELLSRRGWNGIATVGFQHDVHANEFRLLGLHPGWNDSIELAIACGIDMPWLYAQLAAGRPITGPTRYRVGRKRRRVFSAPRGELTTPAVPPEALVALRPDIGTQHFFQDPLPHLPTFRRAARWLRARILPRPMSRSRNEPQERLHDRSPHLPARSRHRKRPRLMVVEGNGPKKHESQG